MKKTSIVILAVVGLLALCFFWGVGINNKLVNTEENVSQAWGQVENAYKRRADLIPQLVATVQGAANYEKGTLTEVIEARAKASSVQVDANDLSEANVAQFQKAQDALSSALTRSINVVVERYPELTATQGFRDLQVQLEGTENRIATERGRFNDAVNAYNKMLRRFPNNIIAGICGFEKKGYLEKVVRYLDKVGQRSEAINMMERYKGDEDLRNLYVDMLIEWRMYDEAIQLLDISDEDEVFLGDYSEKTFEVLNKIGSREKTIEVCKYRFQTVERKRPYYDKLRKVLSKKEWEAFIDDVILNADEVFQDDYDDVEAHIYMERKMYDHLVKFCMHTSYNAEESLEKYAKYMSEGDQRLVAQDIIERMKRRAPECRRGDDYDHFAGWIKRLYDSSPVCKKIAREVAEEIVKENPNKAFRRLFERIGVIK